MRTLLAVCGAAALVLGCGKSKGSAPSGDPGSAAAAGSGSVIAGSGSAGSGSAGSGSAGSGSAVATGSGSAGSAVANLEEARRAGKHVGLAAGEKPEVITEELVAALATGKADLQRFLDPTAGVFEYISLPGGRAKLEPDVKRQLCAKKPSRVGQYVEAMVTAASRGASNGEQPMSCNNEFLATDPGDQGAFRVRYAICGYTPSGEYGESRHVVWVPDAARGVRIAAIFSTEVGVNNTDGVWSGVGAELEAPKPCK